MRATGRAHGGAHPVVRRGAAARRQRARHAGRHGRHQPAAARRAGTFINRLQHVVQVRSSAACSTPCRYVHQPPAARRAGTFISRLQHAVQVRSLGTSRTRYVRAVGLPRRSSFCKKKTCIWPKPALNLQIGNFTLYV